MSASVQVTHLDLATVKAGLENGSILLVDVREEHEFANGHIPGSVLMPLSQFDATQIPVGSGKRIVFSCAAGIRSIKALAMAQAAGLDLSEHYIGGFKEWAGMGEKIET